MTQVRIPLGTVFEENETYYYQAPSLLTYTSTQNLDDVKKSILRTNQVASIYQVPEGYEVKVLNFGGQGVKKHRISPSNGLASPRFVGIVGNLQNVDLQRVAELMTHDYFLQTQEFDTGDIPLEYFTQYRQQRPELFDVEVEIPNITGSTSNQTTAAIILIVGFFLIVFFASRQHNIITNP